MVFIFFQITFGEIYQHIATKKIVHVFSWSVFKSLCRRVVIVILMDGVWKLTNVVITDCIHTYLVLQVVLLCVLVVMTVATHVKDDIYHD